MCTSTENTKKLTLAQKITQLSSPRGSTLPINPHSKKGLEITTCVICGNTRIHPDLTGITCGEPECLLELGGQFGEKEKEVINVLEKVLGILGMENKI
jgi:hypothetical protein